MLVTCLIVANTALLLGLIVLLATFKRSIPDIIQDGLNTVGGTLSEIFEKPQVKRAMTVLGKESGNVRASAALKNKVADKAIGNSIIIKKACEYFGITPLEGLELMQDPTFGPIIQGFISKGSQGLLKGFSPGSNPGRQQNNGRGRGVPLMS